MNTCMSIISQVFNMNLFSATMVSVPGWPLRKLVKRTAPYYYPTGMHKSRAIGSFLSSSSVCLSVVTTKNVTLEDIGIWETLKPIDVSESAKKMTVRSFETLGNAIESCKSCISIGHSYQPHPLSMPCSLLCACPNCWPSEVTHKVQRRQHGHVHARYVLSREL